MSMKRQDSDFEEKFEEVWAEVCKRNKNTKIIHHIIVPCDNLTDSQKHD